MSKLLTYRNVFWGLFLITGIIYAPALFGDFVYDDHLQVEKIQLSVQCLIFLNSFNIQPDITPRVQRVIIGPFIWLSIHGSMYYSRIIL